MQAKNPVEEEEEEEEPARDGKGRMSAWSPAMDGDSEPVPIIPLCAMNRCKDFAKSRVNNAWKCCGGRVGHLSWWGHPFRSIRVHTYGICREKIYIYIYTHTNTFCIVAIFEDLKYSFLKMMSWAKSLISLTRIMQTG